MSRLLVALQFWPGDQAQAMDLARLIADLEPTKNTSVDFLFSARRDAVHDMEAVKHVQSKFERVMVFTGSRRDVGWPAGCNAMWAETMDHVIALERDRKLKYDCVLTIEADCCPLRPGWLREIAEEWAGSGKAITGYIMVPPENKTHINGVAVFKSSIMRDMPGLVGCPANVGWDYHFGPQLVPHSAPSKLIWMDYNRATIAADELFTPRVRSAGQPLGGVVLQPALYHGVKDGSARAAVRARYLTAAPQATPVTVIRTAPPGSPRLFVAGAGGLAGSAIVEAMRGTHQVITVPRTSVDLRIEAAVEQLFREQRPEVVILAAARVGGILSNKTEPVVYLQDNLRIQTNVMRAAAMYGVKQLCFLGSNCIYPTLAENPVQESSLLTGPLEPNNQYYALAKIAGVKLVEAYRTQNGFDRWFSVMPINLYGAGDNYNPLTSHVLPALIHKMEQARLSNCGTECWGSGSARREFMHSSDLADAIKTLLATPGKLPGIINVGAQTDITIKELAVEVATVVGFTGPIKWDLTKPDGTLRKKLDTRIMDSFGWRPKVNLQDGLRMTVADYRARVATKTLRA